MVRESDDAQLDNIARTVFANNKADYLTTTNIEACILFQRIGRNTII